MNLVLDQAETSGGECHARRRYRLHTWPNQRGVWKASQAKAGITVAIRRFTDMGQQDHRRVAGTPKDLGSLLAQRCHVSG